MFYSVTLHCLREALENYCLFIQRLPLTLKNGLCQVSQFEQGSYGSWKTWKVMEF